VCCVHCGDDSTVLKFATLSNGMRSNVDVTSINNRYCDVRTARVLIWADLQVDRRSLFLKRLPVPREALEARRFTGVPLLECGPGLLRLTEAAKLGLGGRNS